MGPCPRLHWEVGEGVNVLVRVADTKPVLNVTAAVVVEFE